MAKYLPKNSVCHSTICRMVCATCMRWQRKWRRPVGTETYVDWITKVKTSIHFGVLRYGQALKKLCSSLWTYHSRILKPKACVKRDCNCYSIATAAALWSVVLLTASYIQPGRHLFGITRRFAVVGLGSLLLCQRRFCCGGGRGRAREEGSRKSAHQQVSALKVE